ncbi:DUF4129 domain-containing protein [Planktothrix sp. FACHB-1355]|uniref:DUF4129 domain-containing protein n=1 Tax=Aerosakkonema funiforme FACHB-1375 TaxID=2949571 RepID=A0A926ZF28_9CYAN|nr:DUF4129 domain-containing protein [Aerosakkonema funiforme]MBD2180425.1 DUF4129 domain-containing protein [Aerosakkonema funiforme FACHB-1375]MBD3561182.1 DUF4129 domain-containing protein [Planktothrix sp. FACHB-1355]
MSADGFEKTNFGWQVQQLQQQFWEWLELKLSQTPRIPNISTPDWLGDLLWPIFKAVSWIIVAAIATWLLWQLWLILRPYLRSLSFEMGNSANQSTPAKEIATADWVKRSQQFYQQGNYGEALRCLYMAMLQKLHDSGIILNDPSRTDGEYRQLTETLPKQESYQILLTTHEELCFGNAEISPETFELCQQAYRKIDRK